MEGEADIQPLLLFKSESQRQPKLRADPTNSAMDEATFNNSTMDMRERMHYDTTTCYTTSGDAIWPATLADQLSEASDARGEGRSQKSKNVRARSSV